MKIESWPYYERSVLRKTSVPHDKCSVCTRVDMIIKDGILYVIEVNTLPGMTQNSLLPKGAHAVGIPYNKLLDMIIEASLQVRRSEGF